MDPGDPWKGAQRALERYAQAFGYLQSYEDLEKVCCMHGEPLARAAERLPHNAPRRVLPGQGKAELADELPQRASDMLQSALRAMEPAWRCEVHLAPEQLSGPARGAAMLAATEVWAVEVAELLESCPSWDTAQAAQWAVAQSAERLSTFLRWLAEKVREAAASLDPWLGGAERVADHARFLQLAGRHIGRFSSYMQGALGPTEPTRAASIRMGAAAVALGEAGQELEARARELVSADLHAGAGLVPAGAGSAERRKIMRILGAHAGQESGAADFTPAAEAARRRAVDSKLDALRRGDVDGGRRAAVLPLRPRASDLAAALTAGAGAEGGPGPGWPLPPRSGGAPAPGGGGPEAAAPARAGGPGGPSARAAPPRWHPRARAEGDAKARRWVRGRGGGRGGGQPARADPRRGGASSGSEEEHDIYEDAEGRSSRAVDVRGLRHMFADSQ